MFSLRRPTWREQQEHQYTTCYYPAHALCSKTLVKTFKVHSRTVGGGKCRKQANFTLCNVTKNHRCHYFSHFPVWSSTVTGANVNTNSCWFSHMDTLQIDATTSLLISFSCCLPIIFPFSSIFFYAFSRGKSDQEILIFCKQKKLRKLSADKLSQISIHEIPLFLEKHSTPKEPKLSQRELLRLDKQVVPGKANALWRNNFLVAAAASSFQSSEVIERHRTFGFICFYWFFFPILCLACCTFMDFLTSIKPSNDSLARNACRSLISSLLWRFCEPH